MTLPATSALYDSLSALERLRMAGQVADGMAYLHQRSPPIIHGDLKAANLLVDEDAIAITDFGLAVQLMTSPGGHGGGSASNLEPARSGGSSLSNLYSTLWTSPSLALSVFISPPEVRLTQCLVHLTRTAFVSTLTVRSCFLPSRSGAHQPERAPPDVDGRVRVRHHAPADHDGERRGSRGVFLPAPSHASHSSTASVGNTTNGRRARCLTAA